MRRSSKNSLESKFNSWAITARGSRLSFSLLLVVRTVSSCITVFCSNTTFVVVESRYDNIVKS